MLTCRVFAEVIACSSLSMNGLPILPIDFDLRNVAGSYVEPTLQPAVIYSFVPEAPPARWSLASTESPWEQTFIVREDFASGFKLFPGRVRFRFRFNDAGISVI